MNKITVNQLLYDVAPISINPKLAQAIGLKEAVVFQQIHYWLEFNKKAEKNFINGRYWTYNSLNDWHKKTFYFLSLRTLERTLIKLEKSGLLITDCFNKMSGDKTKWYSIDYDKLIEVSEQMLNDKNELSEKRKKASKKAIEKKKENKKETEKILKLEKNSDDLDTIPPNWQHGYPFRQVGNTIPPNWQHDSAKLAEPIPDNTTDNTISSIISSSKEDSSYSETLDLFKLFNESVCQLKKTTSLDFKKVIKKYDRDFIIALIEYCENYNAKSYSYFKKILNGYLEKGIDTREKLMESIIQFKKEKEKAKISSINEKKNKNKKTNIEFDCYDDFDISITDEKLQVSGESANEYKELIRNKVTELFFKMWVKPFDFIKNKNIIYIKCPNIFSKNVIDEKVIPLFMEEFINNKSNMLIKAVVAE